MGWILLPSSSIYLLLLSSNASIFSRSTRPILIIFAMELQWNNEYSFMQDFFLNFISFDRNSINIWWRDLGKFSVKCPMCGTWQSLVCCIPGPYGHHSCFYIFSTQISPDVFRIIPKFLLVFEKNTCENRVLCHRLSQILEKCPIWGTWQSLVCSYAVLVHLHNNFNLVKICLPLFGLELLCSY